LRNLPGTRWTVAAPLDPGSDGLCSKHCNALSHLLLSSIQKLPRYALSLKVLSYNQRSKHHGIAALFQRDMSDELTVDFCDPSSRPFQSLSGQLNRMQKIVDGGSIAVLSFSHSHARIVPICSITGLKSIDLDAGGCRIDVVLREKRFEFLMY
jgi:hypothetical protein